MAYRIEDHCGSICNQFVSYDSREKILRVDGKWVSDIGDPFKSIISIKDAKKSVANLGKNFYVENGGLLYRFFKYSNVYFVYNLSDLVLPKVKKELLAGIEESWICSEDLEVDLSEIINFIISSGNLKVKAKSKFIERIAPVSNSGSVEVDFYLYANQNYQESDKVSIALFGSTSE